MMSTHQDMGLKPAIDLADEIIPETLRDKLPFKVIAADCLKQSQRPFLTLLVGNRHIVEHRQIQLAYDRLNVSWRFTGRHTAAPGEQTEANE